MFRFPQAVALWLVLTVVCLGETRAPAGNLQRASSRQPAASPRLQAVRFWSFGDVTRVAIQTEGAYRLTTDQIERPYRLYFDLDGLRPAAPLHRGVQTMLVNDSRLKQIRIAEVSPGRTRVVFDLAGPVQVISSQLVNPDRLMIELRPKGPSLPVAGVRGSSGSGVAASAVAAAPARSSPYPSQPPALRSPVIEVVSIPPHSALVLPPVPSLPVYTSAAASKKPLVTNSAALTALHPLPVPSARTAKISDGVAPATRTRTNDASLVRVFGLKLGKVVIDAGHGGHDTGTVGPDGLMEKDLVLDIALRLGRLVTQHLGAEVIYTRPDDTFIPLEQRTRIANNEKADLFLSIHANSSPEPAATGVETYFFNFTSDRHSVDLATRENAASSSSISDLGDLLHRAVLQAKLEESREFAQQVQSALWASSVKINTRSRDRGVRQAPFVVLIGATMPSILAEVGFVSNPHDEKALLGGEARQRTAEALYKGIAQYANSLSHLQIASAASR